LKLNPDTLRIYAASAYEVAGKAVRVGRRAPDIDRLLMRAGARDAVLMTACNPLGRRQPQGRNNHMMARLREAVRRQITFPGHSGAGLWREAQILVLCAPACGLRLARRFRQNAVLHLHRGQAPRLIACH
jgi:hypothetical protein